MHFRFIPVEDSVFHLWLKFQRNTNKPMIQSRISSFVNVVLGICRVAKWIVNTQFLYQAFYVMQKLRRWVPLVDKELSILPEHPSSFLIFRGIRVAQTLVFCEYCFVSHCLYLYLLSFGYCIVWPFSKYPLGTFRLFLTLSIPLNFSKRYHRYSFIPWTIPRNWVRIGSVQDNY